MAMGRGDINCSNSGADKSSIFKGSTQNINRFLKHWLLNFPFKFSYLKTFGGIGPKVCQNLGEIQSKTNNTTSNGNN